MNRVAVDTSVILACFLNEPEKARLEELTSGAQLVAPGSLPWEIGNALSALFKKRRFTNAAAVLAVVKELADLPVQLVHIELKDAIAMCFRRGIYAYDAYVVLCAQQLRAPLLTLDRRLAAAAREENVKVLEV